MQTKPKSNSSVTHRLEQDGEEPVIVFNVLNVGEVRFRPHKVSDECEEAALVNGYVQNIVDCAAMSAVTREPGMSDEQFAAAKAARQQAKFDAIQSRVTYLESGTKDWKRAGGFQKMTEDTAYALIAARFGITIAAAKARMESMLDDVTK